MKVRWIFAPIVFLALAAVALGAEVAIDGPSEVTAGARPVRLNITGCKVSDLLAGGAKLVVYPRDAEVWDAATWMGDPYLLFFAPKAGKYLVAVALVQDGKLVYAEHEMTAKGGPGPDPPIPPVPPVPGERFVLVVHETGVRSPEQATVIRGLRTYLEEKKAGYRFEDKDLKEGATGLPPIWFQSYLDRIAQAKVSLPALVVIAKDKSSGLFNQVVGIEALGSTAESAVVQIKKYGG